MTAHCENLSQDREVGDYWERQFCRMAIKYGRSITGHQWDKRHSAIAYCITVDNGRRKCESYVLPDVTVWTNPGEHHEIKHKAPTDNGLFGLEKYRFESLLWFSIETGANVFYTIHNHSLNGGRDNLENHEDHWFTANIRTLALVDRNEAIGPSWVNGEKKSVMIYYWDAANWVKLIDLWRLLPVARGAA